MCIIWTEIRAHILSRQLRGKKKKGREVAGVGVGGKKKGDKTLQGIANRTDQQTSMDSGTGTENLCRMLLIVKPSLLTICDGFWYILIWMFWFLFSKCFSEYSLLKYNKNELSTLRKNYVLELKWNGLTNILIFNFMECSSLCQIKKEIKHLSSSQIESIPHPSQIQIVQLSRYK